MSTQLPILHLQHLENINFAMHQNHISVIREFSLTNNTENAWKDITVEITSDLGFTLPWQHHFEYLTAGETIMINKSPLAISGQYLSVINERVVSTFCVIVNVDEIEVHRKYYDINLLPMDQWGGIGTLPEMLSAFVTPNHPELAEIIRDASRLLEKWTGSPSFDEYQTRSADRVRKQMAAIYESLRDRKITYVSVPASFEADGQRVRMADSILRDKLGNCLDLSLLYAACLEAVGIHPLLVITKRHAFAGGWLVSETFADSVNDDPSLLSKRVVEGINEIVVVETTCMNAGSTASFDDAARVAERALHKTEDFVLFIDVKRSRFAQIRPMPLRINGKIAESQIDYQLPTELPGSPDTIMQSASLANTPVNVSKQLLWERKLLDLTLRNNLLNIRLTKSVIQFMSVAAGNLEDQLAKGEEFQILPRPSDFDHALRNDAIHRAFHKADPFADLVNNELANRRIRAYLNDKELPEALTNLFRSSKLAIEENGANTLYVALGMLKWYETVGSEKARYAPILLIPVEIVRKSVQRGFVIRSREEETMLNITLLEMLRQDFNISIAGLEPLPRDEHGVDVKAVFNIIRKAVMGKSKWEVEEQTLIANFSFNKFMLWNDIHNNSDKLAKHKVVASLITGKMEWEAEEKLHENIISDSQLHPSEIALPISTDSSQLKAILASAKGRTFVLHGPPGTGKSQTITNIIATTLYAGKKVLFVASKKAALDVVEKRLEAIGLAPFCLELHSNKSKKSAVLAQLRETLQLVPQVVEGNFKEEADRLFQKRIELNAYTEALHHKWPFGISLFDAFSACSQMPDVNAVVHFPWIDIQNADAVKVSGWKHIAEETQSFAKLINTVKDHPLRDLKFNEYNREVKERFVVLCNDLHSTLNEYDKLRSQTAKALALAELLDRPGIDALMSDLIEKIRLIGNVPASMLDLDNPEQSLKELIEIAQHGGTRNELRKQLLTHSRKEILNFPAAATIGEWNLAQTKWFLPKWLASRKIKKQLQVLAVDPGKGVHDVPSVLDSIINYQEEQSLITAATDSARIAGFLWKSGEADWDKLSAASTHLLEASKIVYAVAGSAREWRKNLAAEWSEGSSAYTEKHRQLFDAFVECALQLRKYKQQLRSIATVDIDLLIPESPLRIEAQTALCVQWTNNIELLKDWYNWTKHRDVATAAGLTPVINAFEQGLFPAESLFVQFNKGLHTMIAEWIISKSPILSTFTGQLFEDKIAKFRELAEQFQQHTQDELYARLAARLPNVTIEATASSEMGILQRAVRNNGRAMSIRRLFDNIPNLLPRLKPCMLMSPISVSQYFDANDAKFDLVIFDEASQMPTCEAVGAIARGENLIVVGDPKQMPPTSFFGAVNVDEENEQEDLESILDDCLALSMPSEHLLWHYRSSHESLISFSNSIYYNNKLRTFPSTDDRVSKVNFVKVDGFYDKGKTRQNSAEANAIVEEVSLRLSDPLLATRSIGIVTFSSVQQTLIEDKLSDLFMLRPDLEKIAYEREEPLFIKNLENVQGDERDVILFSIGYGPDEHGKVSLNFGPINRKVGGRRLNVAVSRARTEMKVFSTLTADMIDLGRTGSDGVKEMKAFLKYAASGHLGLTAEIVGNLRSRDDFEKAVADALRARGFEVEYHVGSSEFKIDIAVVDPSTPGTYLLAIVTDGENYKNGKTAKDREVIQINMLKKLGWTVHRLWSVAWWENQEKAISGIVEAIKAAQENKKDAALNAIPVPAAINPLPQRKEAPPAEKLPLNRRVSVPPIVSNKREYQVTQLTRVASMSGEDFLDYTNSELIKTQIRKVLDIESPVSRDLLCRRVLEVWQLSKLGSRIDRHFENLINDLHLKSTTSGTKVFLWKAAHESETYGEFRVASNDLVKRNAEDIPIEEMANAMEEIVRNQVGLDQEELIREAAKVFGFARLGTNVNSAVNLGVHKVLQRGKVVKQGERLVWKG